MLLACPARISAVVASARTPVANFPADATFVQGEISSLAGARAVAKGAVEALGGIDILINKAGAAVAYSGGVLAIDDEAWLDALNANYLSAVRLRAALLPAMIAQKSGVIVNVSTGAAFLPVPPLAHTTVRRRRRSTRTPRAWLRRSRRTGVARW